MLDVWRARLRSLLTVGRVSLEICLAVTALYVLAAVVLTLVPANRTAQAPKDGIEIFLVSNGLHVDFVLPMRAEGIDWSQLLQAGAFDKPITPYEYVGFGWGERRFLLETPTWADLKVSVAIPATLWPTPAAMCVTMLKYRPWGERVRPVMIPRETYPLLAQHIRDSFRMDAAGQPVLIGSDERSALSDNFYEATGSYHALRTCNVWSNAGLKPAGVRTATWAPFEESIFWHFPKR